MRCQSRPAALVTPDSVLSPLGWSPWRCRRITAVSDGRIEDLLALTDPEVVCRPATRPGLTVYEGHDGMARLVGDLGLAYGRHRIEVDDITADTASQVTARTRVMRETDRGDVLVARVTSVYTLREGVVTAIDSEPGASPG